jgi:hypothetical protein
MGGLAGLDVPGLFPVLEVQAFAVRAFDSSGQDLLSVVSSIEAASFAARGQPIEWLARSWVVENTPAYRRAQADRIVGQIETAVRDLLDIHGSVQVGEVYLDQLWPPTTISVLRARAASESDRGASRDLLDFAYMPQLRDAVGARLEWFDDGCVPERRSFMDALTTLNRVRRKVAHHRAVGDDDLRICREAGDIVLKPIGRSHPQLADDFLVDRWEEQLADLIPAALAAVQSPTVPERGTVSERDRRAAAAAALNVQLVGIETALGRMMRLVVPAQRRSLHDAATTALTVWRDALRDLVDVAEQSDVTLVEAESAAARYEAALIEVRALSREIKRIRVGMPAAPESRSTKIVS